MTPTRPARGCSRVSRNTPDSRQKTSDSSYPVPMTDNPFSWRGKRVFLTGHTGFKGGWLALWLTSKGAIVRGYALDASTEPNLFTAARISSLIEDIRGDIRNPATLDPALHDFAPE